MAALCGKVVSAPRYPVFLRVDDRHLPGESIFMNAWLVMVPYHCKEQEAISN